MSHDEGFLKSDVFFLDQGFWTTDSLTITMRNLIQYFLTALGHMCITALSNKKVIDAW